MRDSGSLQLLRQRITLLNASGANKHRSASFVNSRDFHHNCPPFPCSSPENYIRFILRKKLKTPLGIRKTLSDLRKLLYQATHALNNF
jgi:hypothetical protein